MENNGLYFLNLIQVKYMFYRQSMYVFPITQHDEFAIWRIQEGDPLYYLVDQPHSRSRAQDEQLMQQQMRKLSHAFGPTIEHNDTAEDNILLSSPSDILRTLLFQLKCIITPDHILRALSRVILLYSIDTRDIDVSDAKNKRVADIILQSNSAMYAMLPKVLPTTSSGITNAILYYNGASIARILANARNINYGEILKDVASRAIIVERIIHVINLCLRHDVRHVRIHLANGLMQNVLVCDLTLALYSALPTNRWSAIVRSILRSYCYSTECACCSSYAQGITKACIYARDMMLIWSKTNICEISIVLRALDVITTIIETRVSYSARTLPVFMPLVTKLYGAIFAVITSTQTVL